MKVKSIEFEIKETPDAEKSNEKGEGNILKDDRFWRKHILSISHNDLSYNKNKFTKDFESNTISAPLLTFSKGDIVTVFYRK